MGKRGNGEGSIVQRKDGTWCAALTLTTGKRKFFYGKTRADVQKRLKAAIRDQDQGLPVDLPRQTLGVFLLDWLARVKIRPSTRESYTVMVKHHLVPVLGRRDLSKLTALDVQAFMDDKLATGLSARTVQYCHAVLRRALNQAVKWQMVPRNVALLVDAPRPDRKEIKPLSKDDARRFLDTVKGDRLEALYSVAVSLGLRRGEALALRWSDVDLERRVLTVRRSLQRAGGELQFTEPKTERSRRTVVMPPLTVAALREHRVRQLKERLAAGTKWRDKDLVFPSSIGTPMEPRNALRSFAAAIERAGLPKQRFHDLRHCCASLLLAQGATAHEVMATLGHDRIGTTIDIYGHLFEDSKRAVADRMQAALG